MKQLFKLFMPKKTLYIEEGLDNVKSSRLVTKHEEIIELVNNYLGLFFRELPELDTELRSHNSEVFVPTLSGDSDAIRPTYIFSSDMGKEYEFRNKDALTAFNTFNMVGMLRELGYKVKFLECKEKKPILGFTAIFSSYLKGYLDKASVLESYYVMSGLDITDEMRMFIERTKFTPEQMKIMKEVNESLKMFKRLQVGKLDATAERMLVMSSEILERSK